MGAHLISRLQSQEDILESESYAVLSFLHSVLYSCPFPFFKYYDYNELFEDWMIAPDDAEFRINLHELDKLQYGIHYLNNVYQNTTRESTIGSTVLNILDKDLKFWYIVEQQVQSEGYWSSTESLHIEVRDSPLVVWLSGILANKTSAL